MAKVRSLKKRIKRQADRQLLQNLDEILLEERINELINQTDHCPSISNAYHPCESLSEILSDDAVCFDVSSADYDGSTIATNSASPDAQHATGVSDSGAVSSRHTIEEITATSSDQCPLESQVHMRDDIFGDFCSDEDDTTDLDQCSSASSSAQSDSTKEGPASASPSSYDSSLRNIPAREPATLKSDLATWAVEYSITLNGLDRLLKILKIHNVPDLPLCAKTVMQTPRTTKGLIVIKAGGQYAHLGLLTGLTSMSPALKDKGPRIEVDIFVDGISPYKSSKTHLWVVAGSLVDSKKPFVISMWCGKIHEPDNVAVFLEDFIKETKVLSEDGFSLDGKIYQLRIHNYIADAPARGWLKQVRTYNSYYGCERCNIEGEWLSRVTYNPKEKGRPRTDDSLASQEDSNYHIGVSPLLQLGTQLKSQIPLEPMHLLFLGVMRRILSCLLSKKRSKCKLKKVIVSDLSIYSISLAKFFPSEFARKPRPLTEFKLYKATEFRRILLYDGFLLFMHMKNPKLTKLHRLFACAIRILSDEQFVQMYCNDAEILLREFVRFSCKLFTQTFNVFNVHNLTHLAEECARHGTLDSFSAWKYESSLGQLKRLLHAPGKTLQQIVCRLKERLALQSAVDEPVNAPVSKPSLEQPHSSGYRKLKFQNITLRVPSINDSCVINKDNEVVVVRNIVKTKQGIEIFGNVFKKSTSLFNYPFASDKLGIRKVKKLSDLKSWPISQIKQKAVLLPLSKPTPQNVTSHWMDFEECLCLPMLHFEH